MFLWPLAENSLCQISANNSGISFPCLWSVGVLESLACVGRDSLAKIKTVLQSCVKEKKKLGKKMQASVISLRHRLVWTQFQFWN